MYRQLQHPNDIAALRRMLEDYMRETYRTAWQGTEDRIARDGFGAHFRVTVAEREGRLVGFAAWRATYDLHHCAPGIEVIDMFVEPGHRCRGIGPGLIAEVAAQALSSGARYMTGAAVDTGSAARLYRRVTITHGAQSYLSGRAFRAVAALAGAPPRDVVRGLPPAEWNREP